MQIKIKENWKHKFIYFDTTWEKLSQIYVSLP